MKVDLGCGQITWRGVPEEKVLADIAEAGYAGAPLSAHGGRTAEQIAQIWGGYGLAPAPGYFGGDFWEADRHDEYVAQAGEHARIASDLGVHEVYVSAGGFNTTTRSGRTRRDVAAHAGPDDALPEKEFGQLVRTVDAIARATLEYGVRSCYHNHVGTFVETEDEIERLLAAVDPEVLFLGPDTGHLAWAGVDVVEFTRRHAERIKTAHLKDIDVAVRDRGREAGWDYSTFEKHAIWAEVGHGEVDFATMFSLLDQAGFAGWLIVETDVTQRETPLESARISRDNLRALGV
ncbi:inosose dehydratase [Actinopolymorpha cephalotaxi]|uniref:Inosose dehydratase n=1 Tax=Actinopolymorpha cephalotaxi TaxID=504797 RepID=A0A1I3AWQ2_9ACTN|nr:sugar phosphate isomerase/epimerase [Actinopolymorpha cephalotaxi]NYH84316.1 inosose dehydratase [Actinopolymorpha cephalotaxi]SFH54507.1 inosose dehydratase [Actinopolymorpha cephalotaxi]